MRKLFITIIAVFIASVMVDASAQRESRKVDFEHIKEVINNPNSIYHYPKMLKSFTTMRDTTMSQEACRNFYYGYTFQEDYDPYREPVLDESIEALYYKDKLEPAECDSIEAQADKILQDNLFDMSQMSFFIYALRTRKKHSIAAHRQFKLDRLINAIMSSGKGTKEEPWVVIFPEHEYNIVNLLGYVAEDHQVLDNDIEYVKVAPKGNNSVQGFYFDVSRMMEVARMKYPDTEE